MKKTVDGTENNLLKLSNWKSKGDGVEGWGWGVGIGLMEMRYGGKQLECLTYFAILYFGCVRTK